MNTSIAANPYAQGINPSLGGHIDGPRGLREEVGRLGGLCKDLKEALFELAAKLEPMLSANQPAPSTYAGVNGGTSVVAPSPLRDQLATVNAQLQETIGLVHELRNRVDI